MKEVGTGKYIIGLDVARIVCAAIVVLFHLSYAIWDGTSPFQPHSALGRMVMRIVIAGWVGVPVFFVISGFVIAYSAREAAAITFLRHRIVRLVPSMMICATAEAVIVLASHTMSINHTIGAWSRSVAFRVAPPYIDYSHWTLPVEVLFYGLVFLALVFSQRRHLASMTAVLGGFSAIYCALLGLSLNGRWHSKSEAALRSIGNVVGSNDIGIVRFGIYFALGAALYTLFIERQWTFGVFCIPIFLGVGFFEIDNRNNQLGRIGVQGGTSTTAYVLFLLAFILIALAIRFNAEFMRLANPGAKLVCRRLGLLTYPLYLIHQTTGNVFIQKTHTRLGDKSAVILAVVIVSVLAYGVSVWLEPPFSRWLRRTLEAET